MSDLKVYVLICDGEAKGVYPSSQLALKVALKLFQDDDFTINECVMYRDDKN